MESSSGQQIVDREAAEDHELCKEIHELLDGVAGAQSFVKGLAIFI